MDVKYLLRNVVPIVSLRKRALLGMAGGFFSASSAARLLGTGVEQLERNRAEGLVLGVPWKGMMLYPKFQFRDGAVLTGLNRLLEARASLDAWDTLEWLLVQNDNLKGLSPSQALRNGKADQALACAA